MREFGHRVAGATYRPRPGSYAVLLDGEGRVAVLRTPKGVTLPGGSADPGETPEATLRREVLEECGHAVEIARALGHAVEYVDAGSEGLIAKEGAFFQGTLGAFVAHPIEADHRLAWLPGGAAVEQLTHGSHAWAVGRALEARDDDR